MKFIKWRYNDHGWPNFQRLRLPDWIEEDDEDEIIEYIINHANIPTWSERYLESRIKWEIVPTRAEEVVVEKSKQDQFRERLEQDYSSLARAISESEFTLTDIINVIMKAYKDIHTED